MARRTWKQAIDAWLDGELDRMWLVVERRLARMAAIPPALQGALDGRRERRAGDDKLEAVLAARVRELPALRRVVPLGALAARLGLRPIEVDVVVAGICALVDPYLFDAFCVVRGGGKRGIDLALVGELFAQDRASRLELLEAIDADRPLLRWSLISFDGPRDGSLPTQRPVQVAPDVLATLCGARHLPPSLVPHARLASGKTSLADLILTDELRATLEPIQGGIAKQGGALLPWFVLWGPEGSGRRELATRLAAAAGKKSLVFDPTTCSPDELVARLHVAQRDALVRGVALVIGPIPAEARGEMCQVIVRELRRYPDLVFLAITASSPPRLGTERTLHEIRLGVLPHAHAVAMWERCAPGLDATALVDGFSLTAGDILAACELARASADAQGRAMTPADLRRGVDLRLRTQLGDVVERVDGRDAWDDVVLPDADLERLREFIGRKRYAATVYERWGLAKRIRYGKGMIALFSGPPGTGKTMLAGVIANELELDLYRVDLSQVVSKWAGETEKQLARIFDIAERTQAVLLFDEADALFGKRGEITEGRDRFANLTVNYLLQRLESYPGVAVLTTNKEAALDEALARRLSLHLRLELPEVPERERLWRSFLTPQLPGATSIDLRWLARRFELSGGSIKNAAVRAAFLAAAQSEPLDLAVVVAAVERELDDMGRVVCEVDRGIPEAVLDVAVDDVILA